MDQPCSSSTNADSIIQEVFLNYEQLLSAGKIKSDELFGSPKKQTTAFSTLEQRRKNQLKNESLSLAGVIGDTAIYSNQSCAADVATIEKIPSKKSKKSKKKKSHKEKKKSKKLIKIEEQNVPTLDMAMLQKKHIDRLVSKSINIIVTGSGVDGERKVFNEVQAAAPIAEPSSPPADVGLEEASDELLILPDPVSSIDSILPQEGHHDVKSGSSRSKHSGRKTKKHKHSKREDRSRSSRSRENSKQRHRDSERPAHDSRYEPILRPISRSKSREIIHISGAGMRSDRMQCQAQPQPRRDYSRANVEYRHPRYRYSHSRSLRRDRTLSPERRHHRNDSRRNQDSHKSVKRCQAKTRERTRSPSGDRSDQSLMSSPEKPTFEIPAISLEDHLQSAGQKSREREKLENVKQSLLAFSAKLKQNKPTVKIKSNKIEQSKLKSEAKFIDNNLSHQVEVVTDSTVEMSGKAKMKIAQSSTDEVVLLRKTDKEIPKKIENSDDNLDAKDDKKTITFLPRNVQVKVDSSTNPADKLTTENVPEHEKKDAKQTKKSVSKSSIRIKKVESSLLWSERMNKNEDKRLEDGEVCDDTRIGGVSSDESVIAIESDGELKSSADEGKRKSKALNDVSKEKLREKRKKLVKKHEERPLKHRLRSRSRSPSRKDRHQPQSSRRRSRSRENRRERSKYSGHRDRGDRRTRARSFSRAKSEEEDPDRIDKTKLLKIARRNVKAMLQYGTLEELQKLSAVEIAKLKAGGQSVEELVSYCTKIQRKAEAKAKQQDKNRLSDGSSLTLSSDSDDDLVLHHPFSISKHPNIIMNIRNSTQLPIKSATERALDESRLRITFPVSSGQQHRDTEWKPVIESGLTLSGTTGALVPLKKADDGQQQGVAYKPAQGFGPVPDEPIYPRQQIGPLALPPPPPPPMTEETAPSTSYPLAIAYNQDDRPAVDVSDVVSKRLRAIRRLQQNANDVEALNMMHEAEEQMKVWAEQKTMPGSCGALLKDQIPTFLTEQQLGPTNPKHQAWARRDQLSAVKPVDSGIGMHMLRKLGWRPGEGLGKNNDGNLQPLTLDVKSDKRGLVALEELPSSKRRPTQNFMKDLRGKHPVSALMELCQKRKWGPPQFECVEQGSFGERKFLWKIMVNGVEYQPAYSNLCKKDAKLQSAQVVLQSLGLIPKTDGLPVIIG